MARSGRPSWRRRASRSRARKSAAGGGQGSRRGVGAACAGISNRLHRKSKQAARCSPTSCTLLPANATITTTQPPATAPPLFMLPILYALYPSKSRPHRSWGSSSLPPQAKAYQETKAARLTREGVERFLVVCRILAHHPRLHVGGVGGAPRRRALARHIALRRERGIVISV